MIWKQWWLLPIGTFRAKSREPTVHGALANDIQSQLILVLPPTTFLMNSTKAILRLRMTKMIGSTIPSSGCK